MANKRKGIYVKSLEVSPAVKLTFKAKHEENNYYYNMLDPRTGQRYEIPMLTRMDPAYYYKYINFMKMKERSEETFSKILNWD